MSDLEDTPFLGKRWCPTCEPERDPSREILEVEYCGLHLPDKTGADDSGVTGDSSFGTHFGTVESDGRHNRLMSNLLKKKKTKKGKKKK